jgi:RNA polymerase sigma factor (sigma-70 family)
MKYLRNHEDARDAAVDVFEQLLIKLRKHEVSNFKSWLYSVAKNHCLMKLRKGKNHVELQENMVEIVESLPELHQQEEAGKEEQLKKLEESIPLLNQEQRTCIELFYLKERSYQEIMEQTGFSFKEVKSYIQNGKRNLKNTLMQQHERKTF